MFYRKLFLNSDQENESTNIGKSIVIVSSEVMYILVYLHALIYGLVVVHNVVLADGGVFVVDYVGVKVH